jgi:hypothetical protein
VDVLILGRCVAAEASQRRALLRLACATVVLPALAVVPLAGVDGGFQSALKLGTLAIAALLWAIAGRQRRDVTLEEGLLAAFAAMTVVSTIGTSPLCDGAAAIGGAICLFAIARGARARLRGQWRVLEDAVMLAAVGTAGLALVELLGVRLPWAELRRPESTLGNRNQLAGYLVVVLPVLMGAAVRRRRFAVPVAVLAMIVVVATHCRSAYLSAAVAGVSAALAYALHRRRAGTPIDRPRAGLVLAALALGIVLGAMPWPGVSFGPSVVDSASRVFEYETGSGHARVLQHELGVLALGHEPAAWLTGHGAGSWERVTSGHAHAIGGHAPRTITGALPNSDLLRILVEQGLVGLAILTTAALLLVRRAVAARDDDIVPRTALLASIVAACVLALFDPHLVRPERVAVLGMLVGIGAPPTSARVTIPGRAGLLSISLAAATCVLALGRVASYAASSRIGTDTGPEGLMRWESRQALAQRIFPRSSLDERRALALARLARCDEAEDALERFVAVHPHTWGARVEVAQCFARQGRALEARRIWDDARKVEPHVRELSARGAPRAGAGP